MKLMKLIVAAALATAALGVSTAADARWHPDRHHGWHGRGGWHGHRGWGHCRTVWRHHHRVRVCR